MSDELRLPDDLAAMEARLAAHAPPASCLNRDELMYHAGWAACEARLERATAPGRPAPSRGRVAAWSLASAALAASLAVAATLKVLSVDGSGMGVSGSGPALVQATSPQSSQQVAPANRPTVAAVNYVSRANIVRTGSLGDSIFARRLERMKDAERRTSPDDSVAHGAPTPPPKTALELRQELLPQSASSFGGADGSALGWPWSVSLWGAST